MITIETPGEASSYIDIDLPTEDQMDRLLRLLANQLDRMNDHLAQIAGELHHIRDSGLSVGVSNADVLDGRDRP